MTIWKTLGVKRTADAKAVRKAYAARLKAIDPDKSPTIFLQLRSAYEAALQHCKMTTARATAKAQREAAQRDSEESPHDDVDEHDGEYHSEYRVLIDDADMYSDPKQEIAVAPEVTAEEREHDETTQAIYTALQANDPVLAMTLLDRGLGRGVLGLGEREYTVDRIMGVAAHNKAIGPQEFVDLVARAGWNRLPSLHEHRGTARKACMLRAEAETWFLRLQDIAKGFNPNDQAAKARGKPYGPSIVGHGDMSAASIMLGGKAPFWLGPAGRVALRKYNSQYEHYKPWIAHRFTDTNVANVQKAIESVRGWQNTRDGGVLILCVFIGLPLLIFGIATLTPAVVLPIVFLFRWAYGVMQRSE